MNLRLLLLSALILIAAASSNAQTAQVTFVHCSPDAALTMVDVYVYQSGVTNKVEDISYQNSSIFDQIAIYSDLAVTISVAPSSSSDVSESISSKTFTPSTDAGYVLILSGVRAESGFVPNPNAKPITLSMYEREVPLFTGTPNQIGIMMAHAATDLESSDVYIRGTAAAIATGMMYTDVTTTLKAATRVRSTVDFTKAGDKTKVLASFEVDLASYQSETVVLILSGFKTPVDNNGSENALVLLAVLESGAVIQNELIAGSQKARVQWVHNAPDPLLAVVDVWIDSVKTLDNFGFRKATAFADYTAGQQITVGFAPATSTAYRDVTKTITLDALRPGRSYHFIVSGVADTSKFPRNPNGQDLSLSILVAENALEKSDVVGKTAVRSAHSAPDQASISIVGTTDTYASNLTYGSITPAYIAVAPAADTFWLKIDSTGKKVRGWVADLRGTDRATMVLASGFVNPAANNNGPAFKLILIDASGTVNANLAEVEPDTGIVSVEDDLVPASTWTIAPNPATDRITIELPLTETLVSVYGSDMKATVYTSNGVAVGSYPLTINGLTAFVTVPVTTLASGSYQVNISTNSGVQIGAATVMVTR